MLKNSAVKRISTFDINDVKLVFLNRIMNENSSVISELEPIYTIRKKSKFIYETKLTINLSIYTVN